MSSDGAVNVPSVGEGVQIDNTVLQRNGKNVFRQRVEAYFPDTGQALGTGINTDAWGNQIVSLPHSLFHGMFSFDVPQTKWMMYENGTQTYTSTDITSSGGAGKILTTATNHTLVVESRTCPRYQPNRGHRFSTALWCPSKTADGIREWGLGTDENRALFRLKPDGKLYAVLRSNNIQTYEAEIDTSGIAGFDVEKGNVYDIQFQWRGVGNYYFYINLQLVHTVANLGTLTALSIKNPAMPVRFAAQRVTEDVAIYIGCADITTENGSGEQLEYGSAYAANVAVTTDTPVIVLHQPMTIAGATNTRDLTLARISFTCSKKAVFKVWMTRTSSDITGATYVATNYGSYVECDSPDMHATAVRATAATIANMRLITAVPVEASVPREVTNPWPSEIVFPLVRGDYLVITCTAATATADVVIEFGEHI